MTDTKQIEQGPIPQTIFNRNSNLMEISFCFHQSCTEVIVMNFCIWHDSCAVKFCSDNLPYNGVTLKPLFHRIRITMKKWFMKWAPDFELTKDTPWLVLRGNLWNLYFEYFRENWPYHYGTIFYLQHWFVYLHQSLTWMVYTATHSHSLPNCSGLVQDCWRVEYENDLHYFVKNDTSTRPCACIHGCPWDDLGSWAATDGVTVMETGTNQFITPLVMC